MMRRREFTRAQSSDYTHTARTDVIGVVLGFWLPATFHTIRVLSTIIIVGLLPLPALAISVTALRSTAASAREGQLSLSLYRLRNTPGCPSSAL